MIGANEFTALDEHWNVVYVTSQLSALREYLKEAEYLGFKTEGVQIKAPKAEIHRRMFNAQLQLANFRG